MVPNDVIAAYEVAEFASYLQVCAVSVSSPIVVVNVPARRLGGVLGIGLRQTGKQADAPVADVPQVPVVPPASKHVTPTVLEEQP